MKNDIRRYQNGFGSEFENKYFSTYQENNNLFLEINIFLRTENNNSLKNRKERLLK